MSSETQLILSLAPYLVPVVVAICAAFYKSLLSKLPSSVRDEVFTLVHQCVTAVEQTSPGAPGAQKKQAAVALIGHVLSLAHLKVPSALIDVFIESAVAMMNEGRDAKPAQPQASSVPMGFVNQSAA